MLNLSHERVVVTGGAGFLGRYVVAALQRRGVHLFVPRRAEFDLTCPAETQAMFAVFRPTVIIHLAAEVGGIGANQAHPGRFFYVNMAMGMNLVEGARLAGVRKFVQVGTVCSYPQHAPTPFRESDLWDGFPEPTNAPYGIAKKALAVMLDGYQREYGMPSAVLLPANLYGPGDNFDAQTSHVIPAMIRRFTEAARSGAAEVTCWGSGRVSREFLFVEDAAEAIVRAAERVNTPDPINLGTGREVSIAALAEMVAAACGFSGGVLWDASRPDGQPRRCLDVTRAAALLDWRATTPLEEGIAATVAYWKSCLPQSSQVETSSFHR